MASERISQFLPTVKCSDCGISVEIHMLGEHICSSQPATHEIPIMRDNQRDQNIANNTALYSQSPNRIKNSDYSSPLTPPLMKDNFSNDTFNIINSSFRHDSPVNENSYGRRNPSIGNIYQEQPYPRSTPGSSFSTNSSSSSGALDNLMADLMISMNDNFNITPTTTPPPFGNSSSTCHSCEEEFDYRDSVMTVDNQCYHQACFVCRLCCEPFDQRRTHHEHEGKLYCERDYRVVKNRLTCAACDKAISHNTTPIKALGKAYHPGHIKCYHCYDPIDEKKGWKEHLGKVYCKPDFRTLFIPTCRACDKPVEKEAVSAMDGTLQGKWHLKCFGCHTCHNPFPDNTFYVFENSPYCRRHYHQLNNSLCRTCDEPIEGPCAQTTEGWRFHPVCFECNVCQQAITDVYYMFERNIYCETHIKKLQAQRNVRAEKRKTQFGRI